MKKIILCILVFLLMLSLFACSDVSQKSDGGLLNGTNNSGENGGESHNGSNAESNGSNQVNKKFSGTIESGTVFSDGLALIRLQESKNKTYCIDKEGYIVFEVNTEENSSFSAFRNGYAIINEKIYDRTGKSISPQDVGATKFYLGLIEETGYILATKITSDFTGTRKEAGFLNKNFDWIVSPSEELYQGLFTEYDNLYVATYSNHYLYLPGSERYLNILTGEFWEAEPENFASDPSNIALQYYTDGTYRDKNDNIVIDLREYDTLAYGGEFVNGKAIILFKNTVSPYNYTYYYTIIDRNGVFAFDPVKIDLIDVAADMIFDEEYVIFKSQTVTAHNTCYYACYNSNGEFEGKAEVSRRKSVSLGDGIIKAYLLDLYGPDSTYYYNLDFTPLFE